MTKIETPYLDRAIELLHKEVGEQYPKTVEYQQIKEALKRLEKLEEFVSDLQDDLSGLNTLEIGDRLKTVLEK